MSISTATTQFALRSVGWGLALAVLIVLGLRFGPLDGLGSWGDPAAEPAAVAKSPTEASSPWRMTPDLGRDDVGVSPRQMPLPAPRALAVQGSPGPSAGWGDKPVPYAYRQRNPDIDPEWLSTARVREAQYLLSEVTVRRSSRGGFEVVSVEPRSVYDKAGLRAGDVIYTVDPPEADQTTGGELDDAPPLVDGITLQVWRDGTLLTLAQSFD